MDQVAELDDRQVLRQPAGALVEPEVDQGSVQFVGVTADIADHRNAGRPGRVADHRDAGRPGRRKVGRHGGQWIMS